MNFVGQEREYCSKEQEEEEEEEEELMIATTSKLPFSSPNSSSSSSTKYRNFLPQHHNHQLWLASSDHHSQLQDYDKNNQELSLNFDDKKLDLMEVSLGNDNNGISSVAGGAATTSGGGSTSIERKHMFDKVVTPSDVGKLYRLVIPSFPLDSSSNEKGLLLNFEDRKVKNCFMTPVFECC